MTWTSGLEFANGSGNVAFAEHQNVEIMAARGNQVISGCDVTAQGSPDLTVAVAAGKIIANSVTVAVSADATYDGGVPTFTTLQAALTSGQSQSVLIYVTSAGTITTVAGTAAITGQQLPPSIVEDTVALAMITLTYGDVTINTADIEDWIIYTPDVTMMANGKKSYWGDDGDLSIVFDINGIITTGGGTLNLSNSSSAAVQLLSSANITIGIDDNDNTSNASFSIVRDRQGTPVTMFDLNEAGTLTIGATADEIAMKLYGSFSIFNSVTAFNFDVDGANDLLITDVTGGFTIMKMPNGVGTIHNPRNNAGYYTGAIDEFHWNYNGSHGFIDVTGNLYLRPTASMVFDLHGSLLIRDDDDSQVILFDFNTSVGSRLMTIGAVADTVDSLFNGIMESSIFGSYAFNSQTSTDPNARTETQAAAGISWTTTWNGDSTPATGDFNSFTNSVIDYSDEVLMQTLATQKIQVNVTNPSYSVSGGGGDTWTVSWYYSTDGGSSFTQGGTWTIDSATSSGTVSFSATAFEVFGNSITGDVKVKLYLDTDAASGIDTMDLGTITASYKVTLGTP